MMRLLPQIHRSILHVLHGKAGHRRQQLLALPRFLAHRGFSSPRQRHRNHLEIIVWSHRRRDCQIDLPHLTLLSIALITMNKFMGKA